MMNGWMGSGTDRLMIGWGRLMAAVKHECPIVNTVNLGRPEFESPHPQPLSPIGEGE
ncbi:MAG: hypothetical protein AAGA40_10185 [Cyanobacteria bacterium P01_E01_bin.45]